MSDVTLWKCSAADTIAPEEAAKARGFYEWPPRSTRRRRRICAGRHGPVAGTGGFSHAVEAVADGRVKLERFHRCGVHKLHWPRGLSSRKATPRRPWLYVTVKVL